jgi:hypothetical protein
MCRAAILVTFTLNLGMLLKNPLRKLTTCWQQSPVLWARGFPLLGVTQTVQVKIDWTCSSHERVSWWPLDTASMLGSLSLFQHLQFGSSRWSVFLGGGRAVILNGRVYLPSSENWKVEVVVTWFKVPPRNSLGATEQNYENPQSW